MQPSVGALTGLEAALAALLDGVEPVAPTLLPLDQTLGKIGAAMPPLATRSPSATRQRQTAGRAARSILPVRPPIRRCR